MAKLKETALARLKAKGVRITPQRLAIYCYLSKIQHPTAEELYQALKINFPTVSQATVYNTLRYYKKEGLVRELNFGENTRYDSASDDHYHVICKKCGKVADFHYPYLHEVEEFAEKITNYKTHHRLEFYGICDSCRKKNPAED
ncbi:Fur family transcriptional regulator [Bacillus nakamurai]|uniref:Fur family transcriptional regulator n=1 Tax=Bacillus nakamurai TaxID=1793963 RepID=A0A150F6B8_9BACI|nr:Fur family transcriptional regulator [Bacillus nakamurai]KXZ17227.1 Fur family transcriptional regulator [Bacillus nakamurai]MED1228817.1 Fur family transcriptional regulator [Bacillus nakamurai]